MTWEETRRHVLDTCKRYLQVDELVVDVDGDIPVRAGDLLYYVSVIDADVPLVRVYSRIAHDVRPAAALYERLNSLNRDAVGARVFWDKGDLIAATELVAASLDVDELGQACRAVGILAEHAPADAS